MTESQREELHSLKFNIVALDDHFQRELRIFPDFCAGVLGTQSFLILLISPVISLLWHEKSEVECISWQLPVHSFLKFVAYFSPFCFCFSFIHRFSVNRRIFVVGFGLYGSIHGPTDYQVNIQVRSEAPPGLCLLEIILCTDLMFFLYLGPLWVFQIIHTDSNTVLGQNDTGFSCDGSANTFRVMFKEPVEILPNVNYTACATLKVCSKLKKGKKSIHCENCVLEMCIPLPWLSNRDRTLTMGRRECER